MSDNEGGDDGFMAAQRRRGERRNGGAKEKGAKGKENGEHAADKDAARVKVEGRKRKDERVDEEV